MSNNFSLVLVSLRTHTKAHVPVVPYIYMPLAFLSHQCSASCGEGTQTRSAICRKVLKTGVSAIVNSSLCPLLPFSSSIRPCMLAICASEYSGLWGWGDETHMEAHSNPSPGRWEIVGPWRAAGWGAQLEMEKES